MICGVESVGKSTMVNMLSKEFNAPIVEELGRDYWVTKVE